MRPYPRMRDDDVRKVEDNWKNNDEAFALLDLIVAEWTSDPMSQQCFDSRIVDRARLCVAKRKKYEENPPMGF